MKTGIFNFIVNFFKTKNYAKSCAFIGWVSLEQSRHTIKLRTIDIGMPHLDKKLFRTRDRINTFFNFTQIKLIFYK